MDAFIPDPALRGDTSAARAANRYAPLGLFEADRGFLAFQRRILDEAADERQPLLERAKFLAIVGSNLQEFITRAEADESAIRTAWHIFATADAYLRTRLAPLLAAAGIHAGADAGLESLWAISRLDRPDLHDAAFSPRIPGAFTSGDLFAAIRGGDVLVHHPYESFEPFVRLLRQAAHDPAVERVAITLYRTDAGSPVAHALLEAVARGVAVDVVVEPNARRDEANNAAWAARLAQHGARVTYGIRGLKVHAKLALIVRREDGKLRRYAHVSSGNYHAGTARTYTDLALFTCDEEIGADVEALFDALAGQQMPPRVRALAVAPFSLRHVLVTLIERETAWARRGEAAHLVLKMNALTDPAMIAALQEAARAGVQVDLIVRGACCLRPASHGIGRRIHVRSIVGRFLEHSRAWYFLNGGDEEVYIGSADVMPRNFSRRIEVMVPLKSAAVARRVRDEVLAVYLADNVKAQVLLDDGSYAPVVPRAGAPAIEGQSVLLAAATRFRP